MSRILVTRPEPGASATAMRLRSLGHHPVLLPLTQIKRVEVSALPGPADFDAVLATSANAIRNMPEEFRKRLLGIPLLAVGESTAAASREAGFASVLSADGDAEALAELARDTLAPHASLLYLAGDTRGVVLETLLKEAGYRTETITTYAAPEVAYENDFVIEAAGGLQIDYALIYSPRAGMLLSRLIERIELGHLFEKTEFLVISEKASSTGINARSDRVHVAASPTEDALLALLPTG